MLLMWAVNGSYPFWHGLNGTAAGMDFAMFVGAARALHAGGNPYATAVLHSQEVLLLGAHHLAVVPASMARVASPPLFFWLLSPVAALPFQLSGVAWIFLTYGVAVSGFFAGLRALRWRDVSFPLLAFATSPLLVFAIYPGNVDGIVCGALGWSFAQANSRPVLSGVLASVAAIKPQVGLPLAALLILFHSARPARSVLGFAGTGVGVILVTLLTTGPASVAQWLEGMQAFQKHITVVPDLTSSAGLYAYTTGSEARTLLSALSLLGIALTLAIVFVLLPRSRPLRPSRIAPVWFVVAFLTPFAHYHDFAVLALPFAMIWRDADTRVRRLLCAPCLVACAGGSFLTHPAGFLTASVIIGGCCAFTVLVCVWPSRWQAHPRTRAMQVA
jgi:hypothetical protein